MGSKGKVMIRVGVAACVMSGLVGGYFGLRELLAPRDSSLLKRVGLAGVYLVEHDGQKFLVNSLGGMEKLDTSKDTGHESPPADARLSSATEPNALPTPPPTSYAAHVLDLYRQSIRNSQQYSDDVALGEQERRDSSEINPQKRSSFLEDRQVKPQTQKQESAPSPTPVAQVAPAAQGTPAAEILRSIDKSSVPSAPSVTPISQPSPANAKVDALHPPL